MWKPAGVRSEPTRCGLEIVRLPQAEPDVQNDHKKRRADLQSRSHPTAHLNRIRRRRAKPGSPYTLNCHAHTPGPCTQVRSQPGRLTKANECYARRHNDDDAAQRAAQQAQQRHGGVVVRVPRRAQRAGVRSQVGRRAVAAGTGRWACYARPAVILQHSGASGLSQASDLVGSVKGLPAKGQAACCAAARRTARQADRCHSRVQLYAARLPGNQTGLEVQGCQGASHDKNQLGAVLRARAGRGSRRGVRWRHDDVMRSVRGEGGYDNGPAGQRRLHNPRLSVWPGCLEQRAGRARAAASRAHRHATPGEQEWRAKLCIVQHASRRRRCVAHRPGAAPAHLH